MTLGVGVNVLETDGVIVLVDVAVVVHDIRTDIVAVEVLLSIDVDVDVDVVVVVRLSIDIDVDVDVMVADEVDDVLAV